MSVFYPRCKVLLTSILDGRGSTRSKPISTIATPRSCTVSRNGYQEADTWNAEFDLRVLPFDPELLASCAVRVYMWDSFGDEEANYLVEENEMVRGLVDEPELSITGDNSITISGRDYTGILDPDWDPREKIPSGVPLTEAVQFIADKAAPVGTSARFLVEWKATGAIPISGGSARSTKRKGMWVKPGKTHWDVIYDLVIAHGYIVFVQDSRIVISDPRAQTKRALAVAPRIRYGRDLMSLRAKRKLARERVPQIKIVYWNAANRERFEVIYPPAHSKVPLPIGIGLKKDEVLVLPAPRYCHDRDSALRYARMRWELMARCESTYTIKTRHMRIPSEGNAELYDPTARGALGVDGEYDLLRMQAGDAIGVHFDPFNQENMRALDVGQRIAFLESLGYQSSVAAFISTNFEQLDQWRQPYYARKIEYTWSSKDGISIELEAVNFADERRELAFADPGSTDIGATP